MVKKTYIIPEALTVALGTCQMMAESVPVGETPITDPNDILTKEEKTGGKDIWDEEW